MALKIARGLFRLWLVLSVLWIGGVATVTWQAFPVDVPEWAGPAGPVQREAIRTGAEMALIPPVLVLALGSSLIWAFRGFQS
jgi:hypothetical protein